MILERLRRGMVPTVLKYVESCLRYPAEVSGGIECWWSGRGVLLVLQAGTGSWQWLRVCVKVASSWCYLGLL